MRCSGSRRPTRKPSKATTPSIPTLVPTLVSKWGLGGHILVGRVYPHFTGSYRGERGVRHRRGLCRLVVERSPKSVQYRVVRMSSYRTEYQIDQKMVDRRDNLSCTANAHRQSVRAEHSRVRSRVQLVAQESRAGSIRSISENRRKSVVGPMEHHHRRAKIPPPPSPCLPRPRSVELERRALLDQPAPCSGRSAGVVHRAAPRMLVFVVP